MSRAAESIFDLMALNTLVFAALLGCTLLLKSVLKRKLSAAMHYAIWIVAVARLMIPFNAADLWKPYGSVCFGLQPNASVSAAPKAGGFAQDNAKPQTVVVVNQTSMPLEIQCSVKYPNASEIVGGRTPGDQGIGWKIPAVCVWVTGIGCLTAWHAFIRRALLKKMKRHGTDAPPWMREELHRAGKALGLKREPRIVLQDFLPIPAVVGMRKPVILLPGELAQNADAGQLHRIFVHELMHIRRGDLLALSLLHMLQTVYWFNPLVWICARMIRCDMETACDGMTLRLLGANSRRDYIRTVLAFSLGRHTPEHAALYLGGGYARTCRRIRGMYCVNKTKLPAKLAVVALAVLMSFAGIAAWLPSGFTGDEARDGYTAFVDYMHPIKILSVDHGIGSEWKGNMRVVQMERDSVKIILLPADGQE